MDLKDVAKLVPRWRDEVYAYPYAVEIEGSIKVHGLVVRMIGQDRSMHIHPLSDEISERL